MWYIIRVEGRKASEVSRRLGGERPVVTRWTKPSRKKKGVESEVPLFPGWVFVPYERYGSEVGVPGVYGVVHYGRMGVMLLSEDDMESVRAMGSERGGSDTDTTPIEVGSRVVVIAGVEGVVTSIKNGVAEVDVSGTWPIRCAADRLERA